MMVKNSDDEIEDNGYVKNEFSMFFIITFPMLRQL